LAPVINKRVTAEIEGDFVVFLIGMRINRLCVYNNMPPTGLGMATSLVPAAGRKATAASRAGVRDEHYPEDTNSRQGDSGV